MSDPFRPNRRRFLSVALATAGVSALARPVLAQGREAAILAAARAGLERAGGRIAHRDIVGVADFGLASREPRLHLVDVEAGKVESLLVAHGRGSDPAHTGWLKTFSNAAGSEATSEGCYLTGDYYVGQHGRSMRLVGLEATNSNAEARGIVVHGAWYVGPEVVREHGVLGRSEGCLALSPSDLPKVLARLGPGRLIVARKL